MQPESTNPDAIDPPANVLFVHPSGDELADDCRSLRSVDPRAELRVSFASCGTNRRLDDDGVRRDAVVSIGDVLRATGPDPTRLGADSDDVPDVVERIDDPTDLATIGRAVSRICERWSATDERIVVCVRSLDAFLEHADRETVYRFVHLLTERFASVDAFAHVHLDSTACDDEVVAVFADLFDEVVVEEVDEPSVEATDDDVASALPDDDARAGSDGTAVRNEATDEDVTRVLRDEIG